MDLNLNLEELQDPSGVFSKFASAMETAEKEFISRIKLAKEEVPALQRKLDEKRTVISILNQTISKLTDEKTQAEVFLKLAQDSKEAYKKKLQDETHKRKQLELTLTNKNSLIDNLRLELAQYQSNGEHEGANKDKQHLSTFTSDSCRELADEIAHYNKTRTKSLQENQPSKNWESSSISSNSPLSHRSSNSFNEKMKHSRFNKPGPVSCKRAMTPSSFSHSHTDRTYSQGVEKHRKTTFGESPTSTSSSFTTNNDRELLRDDSIMKIPELYRINYGFSINYQLDLCPHARDFWYDELHVSCTKYFIRFFANSDSDQWGVTNELTVKEQVGLAEPLVYQLKFAEIVQRLEESIKKPGGIRIFVDVRDWNIFSDAVAPFFHHFGSSVSHFSFGPNLYSTADVAGDHLLEFIFKNLPNLEYLAINDGQLKRLGFNFSLANRVRDRFLRKLKTFRFFNQRFLFATPFLMAILLRAPNLTRLYGLSLHLLEEVEKEFLKKSTDAGVSSPWRASGSSPEVRIECVKSLAVVRKSYCHKDESGEVPSNYLIDLMTLLRLRPSLEELDTRIFFTFFIFKEDTRKSCLEKLSQVLKLSAPSLKLLRIEPLSDKDLDSLQFSRLEKCETLQLEMKLLPDGGQRYLPQGTKFSDFFPNLKSMEIVLDGRSSGDGILHTVESSWKGKKASELFEAHFSSGAFRSLSTMKTVQRLNLVSFTPVNLMEKFHKLFPYITILCLDQILPVLTQVLPECFRLWLGLKQLVLNVTFFNDEEKNLDSAFTGIPSVTCKLLETRVVRDVHQQSGPSICNLKGLTLLKLVLRVKGRMEPGTQSCLMTPVSAIYGFGKERMPNLNVIIGFNDRVTSQGKCDIIRCLESMKNYVTIDK